jgi:hypothetical protein
MGIEPTLAAWEAAVLPLNYTRMDARILWCDSHFGKCISRWFHALMRKRLQSRAVYWEPTQFSSKEAAWRPE